MEKTTINDIARLTGLSKGTVDRVLHNRGEVSRKSYEKVMAVIRELGYEPNLYASLLAKGKERTVAVLLPSPEPGSYWELAESGVRKAEALMKPRMDDVMRGVMGDNFNRTAETAEIFGIPLFNVHSAADNMVQEYLERKVEEAQPKHLGDILDMLLKEPEYRQAARLNDPPRILVGNKDARCGKVIAKMTGGTSAPDGIYEELKNAGVGTVVAMHMPKTSVEECKKHHLNVVISGHMASDSLGINLICDEWERHGIEVFGAGGFTRFSRN